MAIPQQLRGPSLLSAEAAVDTVYGSRALRRMILASQEEGYSTVVAKKLADLLWPVFKGRSGQLKDGHAKKVRLSIQPVLCCCCPVVVDLALWLNSQVLEAFAKQGYT